MSTETSGDRRHRDYISEWTDVDVVDKLDSVDSRAAQVGLASDARSKRIRLAKSEGRERSASRSIGAAYRRHLKEVFQSWGCFADVSLRIFRYWKASEQGLAAKIGVTDRRREIADTPRRRIGVQGFPTSAEGR